MKWNKETLMAFQKGARTALKYIIHAPAKERQPQRRLPISIFLTELGIRGNDLNNLDVYVTLFEMPTPITQRQYIPTSTSHTTITTNLAQLCILLHFGIWWRRKVLASLAMISRLFSLSNRQLVVTCANTFNNSQNVEREYVHKYRADCCLVMARSRQETEVFLFRF